MTGYWVVLYLLACGELLVRLNTGVATAQQTYKCDFEKGICSWLKNHRNNEWGNNWILGKGKLNKADTGPSFDHTLGNENGTYLFVNLTDTRTEDVKLETVTLKSRYCLRFFYHMYGPEVPTFMVNLIYYNSVSYRYFVRSKTQGDRWKEAMIYLNPVSYIQEYGYTAVFWISNSQYNKTNGDVALDDIELTPDKCKENKNIAESLCTFDNYKCGYTELNSATKWTWRTYDKKESGFPSQPATDHTLGTEYGGYWVNGIKPTGFSAFLGPLLSNTVLSSPVYDKPTNPLNCLHFFFWVDGNESHWMFGEVEEAYVQVHLNFPDSSRGRQWLVTKAKNISSHREWMYVEAGAIITERFQIQFTSMLKSKMAASVAIDDVKLFAGKCPEAGSCDFEDGKCSWLDGNDQYNWVRKTGKSKTNGEIGPYLDTTKDSPDGGYVVFSTIGKNPGAQASLESEYLSAEGGALCVSFYYQMSGTDLGSLKVVRKESNTTEATLWFLSDDQGAMWKKGMVEMKPSLIVNQVVFRGTIGKGENGFMALDDIQIRKGEKCDLAPPVADPRYENPCESYPCKNDGLCAAFNSTDYFCVCKKPFSGNHCESHPCHSNPCLNDGTCIAVENNYGCVCDEPFHGRHCENDPCTPGPCKNAGLCEVVGIDFNCTCKASYFGKQCEIEIDTTEAISDSTIDDRITNDPVTTDEIECYCGENSVSCRLNWLGEKLCFCKKGYDQRGGTEICSRTCQSNADCRNDGICDRDGLGYFCVCPGTFIGDRCEVDVCNSVRFVCRSLGAECVRQGTIGVCECPRGKKMSPYNYCEDICTYETCVYGTCELTGHDFSQYVCNCYEGYYGIHCENALEYTPAISLLVILASGILLFSITSIVAGCWVKRLRKKIAENSKQTGQP